MRSILELVVAALNTFWFAVAAAGTAWAVLKFSRRTNAATRHMVWWAVLAVITWLPVAAAVRQAVVSRHQASSFITRTAPFAPAPVTMVDVDADRDVAPLLANEVPQAPAPSAVLQTYRPAGNAFQLRGGDWVWLLLAGWLMLATLQFARLAMSYLHLRGIKRRAQPAWSELQRTFRTWMATSGVHRQARLLVSAEVSSPMAVGFVNPAVILPEALLSKIGAPDLDHVLLHELSHLARHDDWTNLLARFTAAALCLNPVAIWILRRIEHERELACDEWVVSATGKAKPYAVSLARLFELCHTRREPLATGMAGPASQLGTRIESLLQRKGRVTPRVSRLCVAGCAAVVMLLAITGITVPGWVVRAQDSRPVPVAPPAPAAAPRAPRALRSTVPPEPRNGSFLAAIVDAGYGDLSVDEIISLRNNGINAEFLLTITKDIKPRLTPKELIELHNNGISPDFYREIRHAGIADLNIRDVIDLHANGVTPEFALDVESAGLGSFNKREIIELRANGVDPELCRALKDAGLGHLEARDIINARANGVGARDVREARRFGTNLSMKQIIKLKQTGVLE